MAVYKLMRFILISRAELIFFIGLVLLSLLRFYLRILDTLLAAVLRLMDYWVIIRSISFSLMLNRIAFYAANKADLVWLFFLKKKNQLFSYHIASVCELPIFFRV